MARKPPRRLPNVFSFEGKEHRIPFPHKFPPRKLKILLTSFKGGKYRTTSVHTEMDSAQWENFPKHCSKAFFEKNFHQWERMPREERDILKTINNMLFLSSFGKQFNPSKKFKICVLGVYGLSGISEDRKQTIEKYLNEHGLNDYFEVTNTSFHHKNLKSQISDANLVFPLLDLPILKKFAEGKFTLSAPELRRLSQKYRGGIQFKEIVKTAKLDRAFFVSLLSKSRTFLEVLSQKVKVMPTKREQIERTINMVTLRSILAGQGKAFSYEDTKHEKY